jgi:DDE superfamily endonuclease
MITGQALWPRHKISDRAESTDRRHHRIRVHRSRKGERKSMSECDCIGLIDAAHRQLEVPIILVWDRPNTHRSKGRTQLVAARGRLTEALLPPYAPDLDPTEGVWLTARLLRPAAGR